MNPNANHSVFKNGNKISPINESILTFLGFYLIIVFVLSLLFNSTLLLVFIRYKNMISPINLIIIVMTIFNLFGSIQFPFVIHSHFNFRWIWLSIGCTMSGFIIYFVGCLQIFFMCSISIIRYNILKELNKQNHITLKNSIISSILCIILSLFWAGAPVFGWSFYSLEDSLVSCSVEYNEKSFNVISYNIGMFIFVFIIPFSIIVYTNFRSLCIIKKQKEYLIIVLNRKLEDAENIIAISIVIYIAGFIVTWTPYTLILIYNSIVKEEETFPLASDISAVIAKSSVIWSTLLYMCTNKSIKSKINMNLFKCSNISINRKESIVLSVI